jgi:SAM-dependent methyltransferase
VADAYDRDPQREWNRLEQDPYHTLEFLVTWRHLQDLLPRTGRILDAGGGPGRYALELCRAGYEVALLDISPDLIAFAKGKFESEPDIVRARLVEAVDGDIRDLSRFESGSFDAVLCLGGPLAHIGEEAGRSRALSELVRVASPGAIVAISVVGRLAALRTVMTRFSDELLGSSLDPFAERGDAPGSTGTTWHFFRGDELRRAAEGCGLTTLRMVGCEGLSTGLSEATNSLARNESKWQRWTDLILKTSVEPAVVDLAEHILYVGRKV